MRLYRFALMLLIFFLVFLFSVNLFNYYKLKKENEALKREYEKLSKEYGELVGIEKRLLEMKKNGEVRGNNIP
jgi:steroid 5-alpha reductase family enzyme